jgi:ectoine hydroxylase-related dioxygenase (phytanoyl-CoA dioxygenase family)
MNLAELAPGLGAPVAADPDRDGPDAAARARMARDGLLLVRSFFDAAELACILRWTDEIAAAPEQPGRHMVYYEPSLVDPTQRVVQRIENFCPFHDGFDELVRRGRLSRWADALLGGPTVMFKEKINFKLPGGDGFKPHQDQAAGWSRYASIFLTALVTLDRSTLANGCLELVAGRHREGLLGPEWEPLAEEGLGLEPVETEPGDVVFFDSYAPHGSKPNLSPDRRRILYLTYNLAAEGDHRARYFEEKRRNFPPDIERAPGVSYRFRV